MASFQQFKTVLVLILSSLFVYLGVLNLVDRTQWKQFSDGVVWAQTRRGVEARVVIDAQASGPKAGLTSGDLLLSVSQIPVTSLDDYTEIMETLVKTLPGNGLVTYQVKKGASDKEVSYTVRMRLGSKVDQSDFFLIVVAFIYLSIGIFIFSQNWKAPGAFHFFLISLVAFILFLYRHSGRADAFDILIYWCSATAFLLLPPLFLHFCCYFPTPFSLTRRMRRLRIAIYLPFFCLLSLHMAWFSGGLKLLGLPREEVISHFFDRLHLTHFTTLFLLGAVVLLLACREETSAIQRQQMKWITGGTFVGVLFFTVLYAIPYVLGWPIYTSGEFSILGLALIPLGFGYAITKYRLMDVELIFKEGAAYLLASSTLLGLYFGIVFLIGWAIQGFSPESGFVFFALSALMIAFLFAPIKRKIQEQIDRYFYKGEYYHRGSLASFGKTLGSEINPSLLAEKICRRIRQTFNLAPVAIFLRKDSSRDLYKLYHSEDLVRSGKQATAVEIEVSTRLFLGENGQFVATSDEEIGRFKETLAQWDFYYTQPFQVHGRIIGFVALGKRCNGDFLSSDDLDLIATLTGYAAIAIDNALLYRSLEAKVGELADLKAYSENVVESIAVGVVVIDAQGKILIWNHSMQSLYGLGRTQAVGKNIAEVFGNDLIQTMRRTIEGPRWVVQDTVRFHKTHLTSRDDHIRLVNISLSPFVSHIDVVTGTLLVFDDITEKVQLEGQLLQAEKLSSIGLFAAGVAHEVNTPLAGISSYAQMLLKKTPVDDSRYQVLKKIEEQSFRASDIVTKLLNFARLKDSDLREVNMNSVVMETLSLLKHQLAKSKIDVKFNLDSSLPGTLGNDGKLQQVFLNFFLNARDAMSQGGELKLRTYQEDSQLVVRIQDNGTGISKEDIKRIYDPFFTTKDVGRGTGLGLSVSYGIIQEHSGRINVESAPGKGTVFSIHFPIKRVN